MGTTARRVVAAPDKFRGTASAPDVAAAVARAAEDAGWECDEAPVADGGEGTLGALAAAAGVQDAHDRRLRRSTVRGPLGDPVEALWLLDGTEAVVEMAQASGLELVGGAEGNDAMRASTHGTGELIAAAVEAGARRVVVGVGGSATTDGGLGAVTAIRSRVRLQQVEVVVACDVTTTFVDAAEVFAPQKGASPAQVELLRRRLERLAQVYVRDFGVDVRAIPGSGAAGGLAGGLAALGATLVPGFDVVADALGLAERVEASDLVVTGEGLLDAESFSGKAVGGVVALAGEAGVPVLIVAGDVDAEELGGRFEADQTGGGTTRPDVASLVERFGRERATRDPLGCITTVVAERLADWASR